MTTMDLSQNLPRKRDGVTLLRSDSECVLCDAEGRVLCALNETASALWDLCDGSTSPLEMVDAVCVACETDREIVEFDVERALREFTAAGLIEWTRR